jgi:hypothetical protein
LFVVFRVLLRIVLTVVRSGVFRRIGFVVVGLVTERLHRALEIFVGGGYGSTGATITNAGNISANGTLTIDGISTLTGSITTSGDIAVNGGNVTTTNATATLFNTGATNLSIGGAATTLTLGATTGTTTVRNNLSVLGTSTVTGFATFNDRTTITNGQQFNASGSANFSPNIDNDVVINTDADSFLTLNGLTTPGTAGSTLCVDASNNVTKCSASSVTLQSAYNGGNTISTSGGRDIAFTLNNTNFSATAAAGTNSFSQFALANGTNTSPAGQIVLVENLDTDEAIASGIRIQAEAGGITNALDLSDPEIVNALSLGANNVIASNFSIAGSTGSITTAGDIAVNGGNVTTTNTTAALFNTNATTLNIGGAATTLTIGNAAGTTAVAGGLTVGGGYGSTGATITNAGNISANGTLTIDGISTLTGSITTSGDIAVNGGNVTTTNATATLFNTGATNLSIGGAATTLTLGATTGTTTVRNNLSVLGTSTVTGFATFNDRTTITNGQQFNASGSANFSPNIDNDVVINTDADSFLTLNGLTTPGTAGSTLCVDGSNNVTKCSASSITLQSAYNGGNTISTSGGRDIAFTLNDTNFSATAAAGTRSFSQFALANGSNSNPAGQLVLVENLDTDQAIANGIRIQSAAGGITNALDLSDPEIVNALSLGANNVTATNFSITGSNGDVTTNGSVTAAGDINANSGVIATTQATGTIFNVGVTNLSIGNDATTLSLGDSTGTTTVNNNLTVSGTAFDALTALARVRVGVGVGGAI